MSISPNGTKVEENVYRYDDRAAKKAEELLPDMSQFSQITNPANYRSVVAAELRKAYAEIAQLKTMSTIEMMCENLNVKHHVEGWEKRCLGAEAEIARLRAELESLKFKTGPVQTGKVGKGRIQVPWSILERAYGVYSGKYGKEQTLERLCERGGFGESELDMFVPGWREEMSEINRLRAELAAQRRAHADIALSYGPDPEAAELAAKVKP